MKEIQSFDTSSLRQTTFIEAQNHWELDENLSDKIWTEKEKNEIVERAVDVYPSKQQGSKMAEPTKISCMECDNENTQERLSESHKEDEVVLLTDPHSEEQL